MLLLLFIASCSTEGDISHDHVYKDGICEICGISCSHTEIADGKCTICGMKEEDFCEHDYINGECIICHHKCTHEGVECMARCPMCHLIAEHDFVSGVCTKCGTSEEGFCNHRYVNGECIYCGLLCPHEGYTCGDICPVCHETVTHRYEGGKCVICGREMKYETSAVPSQFNVICPHGGTVEKVVFQSYDYANNKAFENTFFVYLPYGYYDSDEEYNVLYLLHGSGENSAYWLAQLSYAGGYTEQTKKVLDNLHYYNICKPTIVVTPTSNLNGTANFYKELVNNIMPQAESRYRTKAHLYGHNISTIKPEDFIASRDYRAYAGLSRGSMIGWTIMGYDLAYFSYYGYYSGGTYGLTYALDEIKKVLNDPNNKYDIKYAYHSCGDNDHMYSNHLSDYNTVISNSNGKLKDGVNCDFLVKPGFAHRYNSWIIDLYNSLGFAFFQYNDEE